VSKSSPFFFGYVAAKKNQKTAFLEFRLCGGDEGYAPSTCAAFLKKAGESFSCVWLSELISISP
jgi:hypothetical protein